MDRNLMANHHVEEILPAQTLRVFKLVTLNGNLFLVVGIGGPRCKPS